MQKKKKNPKFSLEELYLFNHRNPKDIGCSLICVLYMHELKTEVNIFYAQQIPHNPAPSPSQPDVAVKL